MFGEPPWKGGDKDHPITAIRDAFHLVAAVVSIDAKGSVLVVSAGMHSASAAIASIGGKGTVLAISAAWLERRVPEGRGKILFRAEGPELVDRENAVPCWVPEGVDRKVRENAVPCRSAGTG